MRVPLPSEVIESSEATKRVMEKLLAPAEVDYEAPARGSHIDVISSSLGILSKTFADINSFELSDGDLPDLGNGIDISRIFEFFKVSSQLRGSSSEGRVSAF